MSGAGNESVALGVNPPAAPANPFTLLGQYAEVQNRLNQNTQFQAEFAAKQRAGQIISQAPDIDSAIAQMKQDPGVAGFIPQIINNYQGLQQQTAQTAGTRQANTTNALHEVMQAVPQGMTDEASFDSAIKSRLGAIPENIRQNIAPAVSGLKAALFDGLQSGPAGAAEYSRRWNAMMLGAGFTPQIVSGIAGSAENVSTPQGQQPVVRLPGVLGGQVSEAPGYIANAPAPQLVPTPSGAYLPFNPNKGGIWEGPAYHGAGGNGRGGNSLIPARAQSTGTGASTGGSIAAGGPVDPAALGAKLGAAEGGPRGIGGIPVMSQASAAQATQMMQDFSTAGVREFGAAQQSLGYLKQMDNDLDTLAKGGGALTPGAGEQWRLKLANTANTLAQSLGGKPVIDPSKVASGEAANKITNTLGFNLVNQFLGGQREAYGTIEKGIQSVPGIENTYLGGKLLVESLRQTAQRAIDQRRFQQSWAAANGGNLAGSVEAFNASFPPEKYAERALARFGMTEKGFDSPQAVKAAVAQGYLDQDQAVKILSSQFPAKKKGQ